MTRLWWISSARSIQRQENFTWSCNTTSITKKAQQHLYFLWRLGKAHLPPPILTMFYRGTIESVLSSCITAWFWNCTTPRCIRKANSIVDNPTHSSHTLFTILPSGKRRRHSHPRSRGHVSRNLIYPPLLSQSQTVVVGGLWNCQSAVRKADFISALASHYSFDFLALTETWIPPQNTATPAALSSAYTFSHSPRESGRGGGTGLLLSLSLTVTPLHISDHHLVSFSITLPVLPKRNSQHLSLTRRNLHSISPSSVASCTLSSLPDHESFSSLPLDSATDTLLSSLSSTMDLLCPLSTIHRKNSSPAPWLSDVLRNNRREL
ncbi:hypothetical protein QTP70_003786 [Hemibagrus guttatus]|uniref:Uncharacterized protein n=1 Tax=Hemibagrus guttatus TaxID=175788 RepID=A0AAE0USH4_9TELE|nr:hypothetical protein QTP70_003786 [Hemibagrus guttatus]